MENKVLFYPKKEKTIYRPYVPFEYNHMTVDDILREIIDKENKGNRDYEPSNEIDETLYRVMYV